MHLDSIKRKCCKRPTDALRQIKPPNVIFTDKTTVPILYASYGQTQLLEVVTNLFSEKSRDFLKERKVVLIS